ncbi:MAG: peptidylprolyl isomerase [Candidatus Methylomirabilota bacterium]
MRRWLVIAASLWVTILAGTGWAGEATPPGPPEATQAVARVNQVEITYGQFKSRLESIEKERGPIPRERWKDLLRQMVQEEILLQGAIADGLDKEAAVKASLEEARRRVLIEEWIRRKVLAQAQVTDEEVRKRYEESKPLFSTETVTTSHIMVKTEADAEAILKELQAGKDFAELAKTRSQDTGSAEKGGNLGALRRGQTVPEFEEAAFRLQDGELSPVIKTEYGYHILKGGPHNTVVQPLDEVKERIRQMLLQEKQRETFMALLADLEKRAAPEVFEDRLR